MPIFETAYSIPPAMQKLGSLAEPALRDLTTEALQQIGVVFNQAVALRPDFPFDTGRLLGSIGSNTVDPHVLELVFGTLYGDAPVDYAAFVEFGTRFMEGRGYFFPPLEAAQGDAMAEAEAVFADGARRLLGFG
ncbi:MAG: hypothetical protein ACPGVG_12560 [Mycobacterium sp.]